MTDWDRDYDHETGFRRLRVAAANFRPWCWHKDWNAERMEAFAVAAAGEHVDLIVLPETCLDGYVSNAAVQWHELRNEVVAAAEPIDGPYVRRFAKLARRLRTCLVFGMAERVGERDVYNTAVFLDHEGRLCGKYHKMQFAEGSDEHHNWNRLGHAARAFDTPLGRVGMIICNDRWNPLIARTVCLDGARLLCVLTYGSASPAQDAAILARARENGVPVVQANVGANLIVSKGEIVAKDRGRDKITVAEIQVPHPPGPQAVAVVEAAFFAERPPRMAHFLGLIRGQRAEARANDPYAGKPPKPRGRAPVIRNHPPSP